MHIGILGGGQLGFMLAESLKKLRATVIAYDPNPTAPLARIAHKFFHGKWTDKECLKDFLADVEIATYEFENVEPSALENSKTVFKPNLNVLRITQNRKLEKEFFSASDVPVAQYIYLEAMPEKIDFPLPAILKSVRGGYDGKAQQLLKSPEDLKHCEGMFPATLEELLPLEKEYSCIVARDKENVFSYPLIENIHENHILKHSLYPARVTPEIEKKARFIAETLASKMDVEGLLTVEFFLTKEGKLYVNECAPRPHNSGHLTRCAFDYSQFDMLAKILVNAPLSEPHPVSSGVYCMTNLLGDVWLSQGINEGLRFHELRNAGQVCEFVDYGKNTPVASRKMGHFTIEAKNHEEALKTAQQIHEELKKL